VSEHEPPRPRLQLVCSSANPDKVAEIAAIVGDSLDLLPRPPEVAEVVEDADSLEGNARLKAAALAHATGFPAVADDTGLEVDALGGRPGVYASRYAGERATYADNRAKLLGELTGARGEHRTARFRTVALVRWPDGREVSASGVCEGTIAETERGSRGFGYDPVFIPSEGDGRTFSEMTEAEKHALSHRGRAFRALLDALGLTNP
jgi:XTP/dITP diphosphohydrolase